MSPFTSMATDPPTSGQAVVAITIDKLISPSSDISPSFNMDCKSNTSKRKRKLTSCLDKDTDLCFESTLPKRQQSLSSFFPNEIDSIVSSVYPSPIDEAISEIKTRRSSGCLSASTEFDVASGDIPDSPNSFQANADEMVSATISPSDVYAMPAVFSNKQSNGHNMDRTPNRRKESHPKIISIKATVKQGIKSSDDCLLSGYCTTPSEMDLPRMCPLPALSWANSEGVWEFMCKKDMEAACWRESTMLERHPGLQPRMRAILLDWLIEVCEVYKLHRETYYLALDYLDRYLTMQKKVLKTHLQLIGITCLFIASKVEEIYPPKIGEFAYVTDGACQEEDILRHEILILQALNWNISPVTVLGWLGVYMQLNVTNRTPASFNTYTTASSLASQIGSANQKEQNFWLTPRNHCKEINSLSPPSESARKSAPRAIGIDNAFIYPQFSGMEFVQTAQLLDLCSLDVSIGKYPYSIIAAAAISHTFNRETALRCSGLNWNSIQQCSHWMKPFFQVICQESDTLYLMEQSDILPSKCGIGHLCPNIVLDDSHIIQTHTISMSMFERACLIQEQQNQRKHLSSEMKQEVSPSIGREYPKGLLTPPASNQKPI